MQKALSLPEVVFNIGRFLSCHNLTVCIRVSRSFHTALLPLLFQEVHMELPIRLGRSTRIFPIEFFDTFTDNIGHVHHLILARPIPKEFYLHGHYFRNLKTLKLGNWSYILDMAAVTEEAQEDEQVELLGQFISADTCPVLKELSLSEIRSVPLHPFWQALQDSKTIDTFRWLGGYKELRCSAMRWAGEQSHEFWLKLPKSIPRDEFLAGFCFKNLHHVEFDSLVRMTTVEQLRFLSQCPELRILTWSGDSGYPSEKAAELFRKNTWPHLHSLDLLFHGLLDKDLAMALDHIGGRTQESRLQRVVSNSPAIGVKTFASLKRHFVSLEHLDIRSSVLFTSVMLQEILSSCSKLRILRGQKMISDDILNGQPWVCHGLKELQLRIIINMDPLSMALIDKGQEQGQELGPQDSDRRKCRIEQALYERFGSLSKLRKLTVDFLADTLQS